MDRTSTYGQTNGVLMSLLPQSSRFFLLTSCSLFQRLTRYLSMIVDTSLRWYTNILSRFSHSLPIVSSLIELTNLSRKLLRMIYYLFKAALNYICKPSQRVAWCKLIWNPYLSAAKSFITWSFMHDCTPTDDHLHRRDCVMVLRCSMCNSVEETTKHPFFQC